MERNQPDLCKTKSTQNNQMLGSDPANIIFFFIQIWTIFYDNF